MQLAPVDFAMSYIQRSGRVDIERLRRISPGFAAGYGRERPASAQAVTLLSCAVGRRPAL